MFCPQCGTESGSGLQYCRTCGANLKVIGKALALSEAIARSDRGPLPKIKEMVRSLKVEHVSEEVSRALERMNQEIVSAPLIKPGKPWGRREEKSPEERREKLLVKGTVSLFSGIGIMIFLYYFAAALVLKLPPSVAAEIPFELDPVVRVIWLVGLIQVLAGAGRIVAGLFVRPAHAQQVSDKSSHPATLPEAQDEMRAEASPRDGRSLQGSARASSSVTENTTNLLEPPE
jgi:hypothetical protein